ncbi:ferredoxin [Burkholderia sp. Bp9140]|uniref:2Fe-2S iron-sulfur cluster-binding protein n=1 Tax=Burkholderia sp. Bp9140 TaxID=2184572 RepID=UPI000F58EE60|nr:2Fe-2S iron-sulfur cluster-binding protein [Burkholderia sp. Bp9140]RQR51311.1 ferredoxin [Burkholderia sp. Bp9140]
MPSLFVTTPQGDEHLIEVDPGPTVMEILRNNGFDDLLALCGGCCSCATCHVYVAPKFKERLPPASRDELDLLEGSEHLATGSRLSCQIRFTAELDGLQVRIAPQD